MYGVVPLSKRKFQINKCNKISRLFDNAREEK